VVFTEAQRRGIGWDSLGAWLCRRPAELAGLGDRKGRLEVGHDADLVVFDPEASFEVAPEGLHHRHALTPYLGRQLNGVVKATFVRGELVYDAGRFPGGPRGRLLARNHAPVH
jgi:allantoinase